MGNRQFRIQVMLVLLLIVPSAHALKRKQNSLKPMLISCRTTEAGEGTPDSLVVFEEIKDDSTKWLLKVNEGKPSEIDSLGVTPKEGFFEADAWTGATRFLKSFLVKSDTSTLEVTSDRSKIYNRYLAQYKGRAYYCAIQGNIDDTLKALQKTITPEQTLLDHSSSATSAKSE